MKNFPSLQWLLKNGSMNIEYYFFKFLRFNEQQKKRRVEKKLTFQTKNLGGEAFSRNCRRLKIFQNQFEKKKFIFFLQPEMTFKIRLKNFSSSRHERINKSRFWQIRQKA